MANSIKNALIIGATGLVGRALVKQLNFDANYDNITLIVRHEDAEFSRYPKVQQMQLDDFLMLGDQDVNGFSHVFSCLGSTIKKAGSKENFWNIDYEINAHLADLLETTEAHFLLVSAMGANARSKIFYNNVKGQLEDYIQQLDLEKVSIIRPSLLLGERNEKRTLENATQNLYKKFAHLVPSSFKYKPVTAEQVAHTMVEAARTQTEKFKIYDNLSILKNSDS